MNRLLAQNRRPATRGARTRAWLLGLGATAALVGAGVCAPSVRADSAAGPTLTVWPVPTAGPAAPFSGGGAVTDAGIAPAADLRGEAVALSGSAGTGAVEITPGGQIEPLAAPGSLGASSPIAAMVAADGHDWALTSTGTLYAIDAPGSPPQAFATPGAGPYTDMTMGLDGHLYLADNGGMNIDRCAIASSLSAVAAAPCQPSPVPATACPAAAGSAAGACSQTPFASQMPEGIAAAGSRVWFTTGGVTGWDTTQGPAPNVMELGAVTADGTFYGPSGLAPSAGGPIYQAFRLTDSSGNPISVDTGPLSSLPHSLVLANNPPTTTSPASFGNDLFAIGNNVDQNGEGTTRTCEDCTIFQVDAHVGPNDPNTGSILTQQYDGQTAPAEPLPLSLPAGTLITSLAVGPDSDIWFTEEPGTSTTPPCPASSGPNPIVPAIGRYDPATGTYACYRVDAPYGLPGGYGVPGTGDDVPQPDPGRGDVIEPGPAGSGTMWFAATVTTGAGRTGPAIGEISDVPTATPPSPSAASTPNSNSVAATASTSPSTPATPGGSTPPNTGPGGGRPAVSKTPPATVVALGPVSRLSAHGDVRITVGCAGVLGRTCRGRVRLRTIHRRFLGATDFGAGAGRTVTVDVRLTKAVLATVSAAPRHRLAITVSAITGEATMIERATLVDSGALNRRRALRDGRRRPTR